MNKWLLLLLLVLLMTVLLSGCSFPKVGMDWVL